MNPYGAIEELQLERDITGSVGCATESLWPDPFTPHGLSFPIYDICSYA